jgi:hypothetical protein
VNDWVKVELEIKCSNLERVLLDTNFGDTKLIILHGIVIGNKSHPPLYI